MRITLFALLATLPLTMMVGCEGDGVSETGEVNTDCPAGQECWDGDTGEGVDFASAQLHVTIPYGWTGDVLLDGDVMHENTNECLLEVTRTGEITIAMRGENFICTPISDTISDGDDGNTIEYVSDGEGECGLAPEGMYGDFDVFTEARSDGYVWITMAGWIQAVVTEDTFFYEDSEMLVDGTIAEDLESITYHILVKGNGNEDSGTITR
jgi:hypothetical protein